MRKISKKSKLNQKMIKQKKLKYLRNNLLKPWLKLVNRKKVLGVCQEKKSYLKSLQNHIKKILKFLTKNQKLLALKIKH